MTLPALLLLQVMGASASAEASVAVPAPVSEALLSALAVEGGRVIVRAFQMPRAPACRPREASVDGIIDGSGRYPVRLRGPGCPAWAWARIEVWAAVPVTTRAVAPGEELAGAVIATETEVRRARAPARLIPGARASRRLSRGQMVEVSHLQAAGAASGGAIKVLVRAGALQVVQTGRLVACGGGRTCAVMPSGKHVSGQLADGHLVVEAP